MKDYICPECGGPFSDHSPNNSFMEGVCLWRFNFHQGEDEPPEGSKVLCKIKETEFYKKIVDQLETGIAVVNTTPIVIKDRYEGTKVVADWVLPKIEPLTPEEF